MKKFFNNSNLIQSEGLISKIRMDLANMVTAAESQKLPGLTRDSDIKKSLSKVRMCNSQKSKAQRGMI